MKIPSLMRVPKYKRFNFEPRHYDPIKEEIKNRTELIQQQLKNEANANDVKQRISQAFVRDKRKSAGGINKLQLAMVFLMSLTFIGFLYIGFYAFLITGVIILLYILQQKGVFDTKEPLISSHETDSSQTNRIAGQFKEGKYFVKERGKRRNGWYKLFLLMIAAGIAAAYYLLYINGIVAIGSIFILLILFIKESNKT